MDIPSSPGKNAAAEACCCGCGPAIAASLWPNWWPWAWRDGVRGSGRCRRCGGAEPTASARRWWGVPAIGGPRHAAERRHSAEVSRAGRARGCLDAVGGADRRRAVEDAPPTIRSRRSRSNARTRVAPSEVKEMADEQTGAKSPKFVCPCHKAYSIWPANACRPVLPARGIWTNSKSRFAMATKSGFSFKTSSSARTIRSQSHEHHDPFQVQDRPRLARRADRRTLRLAALRGPHGDRLPWLKSLWPSLIVFLFVVAGPHRPGALAALQSQRHQCLGERVLCAARGSRAVGWCGVSIISRRK